MYLKHICLSCSDAQSLQKHCEELHGVIKILPGIIVWQDVKETDAAEMQETVGIRLSYNPKKTDLSALFDAIFAVFDPYVREQDGETAKGIYYEMSEDEPQVEYYINFLNSRGKPPAVTGAQFTVNDPMTGSYMARRCVLQVGKVKTFRASIA